MGNINEVVVYKIGSRVQSEIERTGLPRRVVFKRSGLSKGTFYDLTQIRNNGRYGANLNQIEAIAQGLGTTLGSLLEGVTPRLRSGVKRPKFSGAPQLIISREPENPPVTVHIVKEKPFDAEEWYKSTYTTRQEAAPKQSSLSHIMPPENARPGEVYRDFRGMSEADVQAFLRLRLCDIHRKQPDLEKSGEVIFATIFSHCKDLTDENGDSTFLARRFLTEELAARIILTSDKPGLTYEDIADMVRTIKKRDDITAKLIEGLEFRGYPLRKY